MKPFENQKVLVTGASGGIGLELARLFAEGGADLVIVARSLEKLQATARNLEEAHGIRVQSVGVDLARVGGARQAWETVEGEPPDVVVNNAGFGDHGPFSEASWERQEQMVALNIRALTELTHLGLEPMLSRGRGGILNVASTAAFQPGPLMSVYFATKAYVLSFSEALHEEVKRKGVRVSALCPGPVATGFEAVAGMGNSKLFEQGNVMSAVDVARAGYKGFRANRAVVVPGVTNRLMAAGVRFTPRSVVRRMLMRLQGGGS